MNRFDEHGGIYVAGSLLASIEMAMLFTLILSYVFYQGLDVNGGRSDRSTVQIINYSTLIRTSVILLLSIASLLSKLVAMEAEVLTTFNNQFSAS